MMSYCHVGGGTKQQYDFVRYLLKEILLMNTTNENLVIRTRIIAKFMLEGGI